MLTLSTDNQKRSIDDCGVSTASRAGAAATADKRQPLGQHPCQPPHAVVLPRRRRSAGRAARRCPASRGGPGWLQGGQYVVIIGAHPGAPCGATGGGVESLGPALMKPALMKPVLMPRCIDYPLRTLPSPAAGAHGWIAGATCHEAIDTTPRAAQPGQNAREAGMDGIAGASRACRHIVPAAAARPGTGRQATRQAHRLRLLAIRLSSISCSSSGTGSGWLK